MWIYILLISIIIILGLLISKKHKKSYCIIIGIFLLFLIGCRDKTMGIIDTEYIYLPTYNKISNTPIEDINEFFSKDIAFHYITKLFIMICNNSQLWLGFIALPLIVGCSILVYRESKNPMLSFILFLALNYYRYVLYIIKTFHCIRNNFIFL